MMRFYSIVVSFILGLGVVAVAQTRRYSSDDAANFTRACAFPNAPTQITTSGSSQQTAVLRSATVYRVLCAEAAYVAQGSNPTAATTSMRVVKDAELYVLSRNSTDKLAFRQVSTSGVCEVTECQ